MWRLHLVWTLTVQLRFEWYFCKVSPYSLCEQLARELDKLSACRKEYAEERSKWMELLAKAGYKEDKPSN